MAKRRGQREGSIYRMKDGRWRAAISIGWKRNGNGEVVWRRRVITGKTRQAVHDQLTAALRDQQRGINIDPTRQTIGEFLATSDRGVVMWRKMAFDSIDAVKEGRDPHGIVRDAGGNDVIRFDAGKNFSDHDKSPVSAS